MSNQDPENPPPPPQPHPYGAPAYGGYQPVPDHPQATTVLVLGIIGILIGVTAPVAWVMGSRAKREIEASGGRLGGLQQVTIGWILGIVMTILLVISVIGFVLIFVVVLGVFASVT